MRTITENKITYAVRQMLAQVHDLADLAARPTAIDKKLANDTEEFIRDQLRDVLEEAQTIHDEHLGSHVDLLAYIDLDL